MTARLPRKLILAALLSSAVIAMAQMPPPVGSQGQGQRPHNGMRGCHRGPPIDELSTQLNLQPKQRAALETALEQRHQALEKLRDETRSKADALQAQSYSQLAKVLSSDQLGKYLQWEQSHRPSKKMSHRGGMGNHGGPQGVQRGGPPGSDRRGEESGGGRQDNRFMRGGDCRPEGDDNEAPNQGGRP